MIKKITVLLFFISQYSLCHAHVSGGEYIHVPEKRAAIGIFPDEQGVTVGDVGYEAKFCEIDSDYICLETKVIKFAVPKNLQHASTWIHKGEKYKILQRFSTRGDHPAWVVEKYSGNKMWFVWSPFNGLMMFGERGAAGVYMLDGFCGFGSSAACDKFQRR